MSKKVEKKKKGGKKKKKVKEVSKNRFWLSSSPASARLVPHGLVSFHSPTPPTPILAPRERTDG